MEHLSEKERPREATIHCMICLAIFCAQNECSLIYCLFIEVKHRENYVLINDNTFVGTLRLRLWDSE